MRLNFWTNPEKKKALNQLKSLEVRFNKLAEDLKSIEDFPNLLELNNSLAQTFESVKGLEPIEALATLEPKIAEVEKNIQDFKNRVDYHFDNKNMSYVLSDKNGFKYYIWNDSVNMDIDRYWQIYIPKRLEMHSKISESDLDLFLGTCEKFTNISQYREAHAILKLRKDITFDTDTVWTLASILLHRQDEKSEDSSMIFTEQKKEAIKQATIGRVGDFFQILGLWDAFNLERMSESSLMLLTENLKSQKMMFEIAMRKMSGTTTE